MENEVINLFTIIDPEPNHGIGASFFNKDDQNFVIKTIKVILKGHFIYALLFFFSLSFFSKISKKLLGFVDPNVLRQ